VASCVHLWAQTGSCGALCGSIKDQYIMCMKYKVIIMSLSKWKIIHSTERGVLILTRSPSLLACLFYYLLVDNHRPTKFATESARKTHKKGTITWG
jgi:hypothetical protein